MKDAKWIEANIPRLAGKTVAITGSTGGLGRALARLLLSRGASLLLLDRDGVRSSAHRDSLLALYPTATVTCCTLDLSSPASVLACGKALADSRLDILIHNAGAYHLPREKGSYGYDRVFEIDAIAPYLLTRALLPALLRAERPCVTLVGSIACRLARIDPADPDYTARSAVRAYGNAKRCISAALPRLLADTPVRVAIAHPGISPTGIISSYPRALRAVAAPAMKLLFPAPARACLSVALAATAPPPPDRWIGPRILGVWGKPRLAKLKLPPEECARAQAILEESIKSYICV